MCIYVCVYVCKCKCAYVYIIHMKSSFPKYNKRHSTHTHTNWVSNVNRKVADCVKEKSSSSMYVYTYVYIYILMKSSSPKQDFWHWHWHWNPSFWNGVHHVLEKSSSYVSVRICVYLINKTSDLHRWTTPLYRSLYLGLKQSPVQYHCNNILTH